MQAVWASLFVTTIGSVVLWCATDGLQAITAEGARRISVARVQPVVPDVALQTMLGSTTHLVSGDGKFTFVEFIYTRCPTICQTAGTNLARLRDRLGHEQLNHRIRILSISFDPSLDGIRELSSYGKAYGADGEIWTVTRPVDTELSNLLDAFGVVVIPNGIEGFEHNAALHVINPSGQLISIFDIDDVDGAISSLRRALP